ncbi:MAG: hypothetical protein ACQETJ_02550 [Bacteroidota bacterium]
MNELKKVAPKLSEIKKEHPFRVPDNYFDDFSSRLHTRLETEKKVLSKPKSRIIRLLKPALGLAASFILVFLLVYWPIKSFLPNYLAKSNTAIETVITEEDTYLSILEKIDENSFFALLTESSDEEVNDFNDEELLSYVSSNFTEYEIYLETDNK